MNRQNQGHSVSAKTQEQTKDGTLSVHTVPLTADEQEKSGTLSVSKNRRTDKR